jgi:YVTN family beta-propeller protein
VTAGFGLVHYLRPDRRIRTRQHPACFHRATLTRPGSLHPARGHAPRPFGIKIFYFRTSPPPPRNAARSRPPARRWLTVRGNSSLPPRWPHPNPASVSLHLGGRQNRGLGVNRNPLPSPDLAAARTAPNPAAIPANPQAPLWRPSGQDSPAPHRSGASQAAGTVTVINPSSSKITATVTVGDSPYGIAVSP